MEPTRAPYGKATRIALAAAALLLLTALSRPWFLGGPWPDTSTRPVRPLSAVSPDSALAAATFSPGVPFRFAVFGDQRALADGEWQDLLAAIAREAQAEPYVRFMIDTGDIVDCGRHADQFDHLGRLLSHGPPLPYLPAIGNHELENGRSASAAENTARAVSYVDAAIAPDRLYYRRDIGGLRFLFLDSNAFVYRDTDSTRADRVARAQAEWLARELAPAPDRPRPRTIVVMHHPMVQSSRRHAEQARALWGFRVDGRALPDLFVDGGVELVLTGHTHTFERFRIERRDGRGFALVNLSGRPRGIALGLGGKSRMAGDIRGREREWLAANGWHDLEDWTIVQEEHMSGRGADQTGFFTVEADGRVVLETCYLDDDAPGGLRRSAPVVIAPPGTAAQ